MTKPATKSTYIFNQFFLNTKANDKTLQYFITNIYMPEFAFFVPDLSGNDYYKCEITLDFYSDTNNLLIKYEKWLWSGSSWASLSSKTLETINYESYDINKSEVESLELGIHIRIELDGSDTILYYQNDFYVDGVLKSQFTDDIYTFTGLTRDNIYFKHMAVFYGYVISNMLTGYRCIYLDSTDYTTNFIDIVNFYEEIPYIEGDRTLPDTYWTYLAYRLVPDNTVNVSMKETITFFGEAFELDYSYPFTYIKGEAYTGKFYYNPTVLRASSMGDWGIFNWVRDGLCWVVNSLLLGFQFLLFILVVAISFLFGWLFLIIVIPFLYNVIVYWLLFALVFVLLWATIGILLIVNAIIVLLEWLLVWFVQDALPFIIEALIFLLSWIFALLLYVITLGQSNIEALQLVVSQFLTSIADFFMTSLAFMIMYLPEMLLYTVFYIILVGFCYLKLTYVSAKGYVNRASQLEASLKVYIMPINAGKNAIIWIKDTIIGWW